MPKRHFLEFEEYEKVKKAVVEQWKDICEHGPTMDSYAQQLSRKLGFEVHQSHVRRMARSAGLIGDKRRWPSKVVRNGLRSRSPVGIRKKGSHCSETTSALAAIILHNLDDLLDQQSRKWLADICRGQSSNCIRALKNREALPLLRSEVETPT